MISSKLFIIIPSLIIGAIIPLYTWKTFFNYKQKALKEYERKKLHWERHNCVVTYIPDEGFSGWAPNKERIKPTIQNPTLVFDPLMYFIETTEKTLDIAVMILTIDQIFHLLEQLAKKGVQIRLILNGQQVESTIEKLRKLQKLGVKVVPFINQGKDTKHIMHSKLLIKDFDSVRSTGYLCLGSLNLTQSATFQNYENVVFLTDKSAVKKFHEFYERLYKYCSWENENSVYNQCLLEYYKLDS